MNKAVTTAARLVRAGHKAWEKKVIFFTTSVAVFGVTLSMLTALDLLPERISTSVTEAVVSAPSVIFGITPVVAVPEAPIRITASVIGLDATIENPNSTDIATLDEALLKGAVRYPTSARLGESGNVVVFGHSSYLPVVHNKAYKTFDGIQDLKTGDTIVVYSANKRYTYAVEGVEKVKAEDGAIPLQVTGHILTLATCDSFGTKSDRFVVTAVFVESEINAS